MLGEDVAQDRRLGAAVEIDVVQVVLDAEHVLDGEDEGVVGGPVGEQQGAVDVEQPGDRRGRGHGTRILHAPRPKTSRGRSIAGPAMVDSGPASEPANPH